MRSISFFSTSRSDLSSIVPIIDYLSSSSLSIHLFIAEDLLDFLPPKFPRIISIHCISFRSCDHNSSFLDVTQSISIIFHSYEQFFLSSIIFILGDRWEILHIAFAALYFNIPLIHHSGGDITNGAIDNQIRDAVTSLSDFHLTSHSLHTKRLISLGEDPSRITTVGETSLHSFSDINDDVDNQIDFVLPEKFILFCFHPTTLDTISFQQQADVVCSLIKSLPYPVIATYPNMDPGGFIIHSALLQLSQSSSNIIKYIPSLYPHYFYYLSRCSFLIGNTSSGILEAPFVKTLSINIGNRQDGRLCSPSTLSVSFDLKSIMSAVSIVTSSPPTFPSNFFESPYYISNCLPLISDVVQNVSSNPSFDKKKLKYF